MTTVEEGKGEAPSDGEAAATASIIAMFSFAGWEYSWENGLKSISK